MKKKRRYVAIFAVIIMSFIAMFSIDPAIFLKTNCRKSYFKIKEIISSYNFEFADELLLSPEITISGGDFFSEYTFEKMENGCIFTFRLGVENPIEDVILNISELADRIEKEAMVSHVSEDAIHLNVEFYNSDASLNIKMSNEKPDKYIHAAIGENIDFEMLIKNLTAFQNIKISGYRGGYPHISDNIDLSIFSNFSNLKFIEIYSDENNEATYKLNNYLQNEGIGIVD